LPDAQGTATSHGDIPKEWFAPEVHQQRCRYMGESQTTERVLGIAVRGKDIGTSHGHFHGRAL
jgi:hypothetical protein